MATLAALLEALVLAAQRAIDRVALWARGASVPDDRDRRLLIVQIDGLSREVLEHAFARGRARGLRRLLATGRLVMRPMSVGLPSSTPAFQAAVMYGVQPDIPGFHYYDKRERRGMYFPAPGVADRVQEAHARGRRGIVEGGSTFGCIFTGGAEENLWTLARLLRPSRAGGSLLRLPLSSLLLAWIALKCVVLTAVEVVRALRRWLADPAAERERGGHWLLTKIGISIWIRQVFTLAASSALYRGAPAVYVNYLDYDVFAHAFGPGHAEAVRALDRVASSIWQLSRVVRRLADHRYDLFVLSDHGQVATHPFTEVSGGTSLDEVVFAAVDRSGGETRRGAAPGGRRDASRLRAHVRGYRARREKGVVQRFLNYMERDFPWWIEPETVEVEGVRVVRAGPNAFVYFTDVAQALDAEAIEARHPGLAATLSRHRGVGFVLMRGREAPVCWYRGSMVDLDARNGDDPFANRPDRDVVVSGIRDLMAMPSAGDLVLYGTGAVAGDVSFIDERGAHAGPSAEEMQTFLMHPREVEIADADLTHPTRLYPHFLAYQRARRGA